ncbi:MAG: hypothetical protein EBR86_12775, partial [Planctomycetia bacterium]|nr:hypothetical protein [Planctomycetia bacterium]
MSTAGSKPRSEIDVWQAARDAADAIVALPPLHGGGEPLELFLRRVEASGSAGFRMGSRGNDFDEEPTHRVVIADDFYLGTFVVTQDQWAAVWPGIDAARWYPKGGPLGDAPGPRPGRFGDQPDSGSSPVEQVSWYDALAFCEWLTAQMKVIGGRKPPVGEGWRFCLPTESEWEYACRGGLEGAGRDREYWNGDGEAALREVGWFDGNSGDRTHAVTEPVIPGDPEAHPLGLCGMHGNVWEWCHDEGDAGAYRRRLDSAADPAVAHRAAILRALLQGGPTAVAALVPRDRDRVVRGGSWVNSVGGCRSACRDRGWPGDRGVDLGFRVCLVRGPAAEQQAVGGGAAAGKQRAQAEQAQQGKASGTRPQPSAAGEAGAAPWRQRGRGVVGRERVKVDNGDGKALLAAAAGRSPAARFSDGTQPAEITCAVIGKRGESQPCGHARLDFSSFTGLTHLYLWDLSDLEEITGLPENLVCLDVRGCTNLRSLPGKVFPFLETLDLGGCSGLAGIPAGFAAPNLRWLYLDGCDGIPRHEDTTDALHALLKAASSLEEASLVDCPWVESLRLPKQVGPPCVASTGDPRFPERHLKKLVLRGCTGLESLPNLCGYRWLHHLDVRGCSRLEAMPALPVGVDGGLPTGIRTLYATGCDQMRSFLNLDIRRVHRGESTAAIGESAAAGQEVNVAEQFRTLSTLADDPAELRMAKVLFLGSGRCGKTTVAKALRWHRYSDEQRKAAKNTPEDPDPDGGQLSTSNIRLDLLDIRVLNTAGVPGPATSVHVWDFGGQEIYHNTHRLFASEGAVFVIVTTDKDSYKSRLKNDIETRATNDRSAEEYERFNSYHPVAYWLDYVWEARGVPAGTIDPSDGRSPHILVVVTGTADRQRARELVLSQAGNKYRHLFDEDLSHRIQVKAADFSGDVFGRSDTPVDEAVRWVESRAAAVADELGVKVPRLYANLDRICTHMLATNQSIREARKKGQPSVGSLRERLSHAEWTTEVAGADGVKNRPPATTGAIARSVALFLHGCGRVFSIPKADTVIVDQQWAVELVYEVTVTSLANETTRSDIHANTHAPFSANWFQTLFNRNPEVQKNWDFLLGLLDACNIVIGLGDGEYLTVHPELLPPLAAAKAGELVKQWDRVEAGPEQGDLVNHSFAIHDTGTGLILGRSAFRNVVATVGRTMHHGLPWHLFFGEKDDGTWPVSWATFASDGSPFQRESYFWRDGFQIKWKTESSVSLPTEGRHGSRERVPEQVLVLRMEWKNGSVDGGFRGGIFVQMLCDEEATKAERLKFCLFGDGTPGSRRGTGATRSEGITPPLLEYRMEAEESDLRICDHRFRDIPAAHARSLRGVGQPGWLHPDGPEQ